MLQAMITLAFIGIALLAGGLITTMLAAEWPAIRRALGLEAAPVLQPVPLPPRYRAEPMRRVTAMTVREAAGLRAAA